jgi:hypothetical protein
VKILGTGAFDVSETITLGLIREDLFEAWDRWADAMGIPADAMGIPAKVHDAVKGFREVRYRQRALI